MAISYAPGHILPNQYGNLAARSNSASNFLPTRGPYPIPPSNHTTKHPQTRTNKSQQDKHSDSEDDSEDLLSSQLIPPA
ncbi:hypothetical protein GJ744_005345 [Endocarpon pusillum]|uniref:Uncharacterized protein n=1 Tax=Endocarpon pusillum TaxID=364733 RepID=A0A8H7APG4_9EURO|nr:hypothetical protein GJ744_005345 [Endocarpon pusillum]